MDERILEDAGLTKGEAKVYLTLLRLGETTTGKIVEEAQISSGKIYEILEKLIRKGLASYVIKGKTKHFSASSPNRILDYLKRKEQELRERERELAKELPLLLSMEKSGSKPNETMLFKGLEGIRTAISEALEGVSVKDEVLAMGIRSGKDKRFNFLWRDWHRERVRRKVRCRGIFSDAIHPYYKEFRKMQLTDTRVLKGITPSAIDVMGNRVLIFTYGETPSCLSIRNQEVAQSFRSFFENLWKAAR